MKNIIFMLLAIILLGCKLDPIKENNVKSINPCVQMNNCLYFNQSKNQEKKCNVLENVCGNYIILETCLKIDDSMSHKFQMCMDKMRLK